MRPQLNPLGQGGDAGSCRGTSRAQGTGDRGQGPDAEPESQPVAAAGGRAALSLLAGGKRQPVPPAGQCYYNSPVSCDFRPHAGARHSRCGFRKTQRAEGRRAGGGGVGTHRRQSMTGSAPRVSTCRACGLSAGGWGGVVLLLCPPPAPSPRAEPVREQAGGEWPCGRGPARGAVSGV